MTSFENASSQKMGQILNATPFMASVTVKNADSWRIMAEFAERAGLMSIEILLRSAHAEQAVFQIKENFPGLKVGLGTVLTKDDFKKAQDCRADFVVSPGSTPELMEHARDSGVAYLPGVMTPSEIQQAQNLGFFNSKLFPAGYLHESFIKALEGPYPQMRYCVSGAVGEENWPHFAQYRSVRSIGGTWVLPADALEEGLAQKFIERLEERHFQFAKLKSLL